MRSSPAAPLCVTIVPQCSKQGRRLTQIASVDRCMGVLVRTSPRNLLDGLFPFPVPVLHLQNFTQVGMSKVGIRVELERLVILSDRFRITSGNKKSEAQIAVDRDRERVEFDGAFHFRDRTTEIADAFKK